MNAPNFLLEMELSVSEVRKLNKMYFKYTYKRKVLKVLCIVLFFLVFFDLRRDIDLFVWIIRSLSQVILFLIFQQAIVSSISKIIFRLVEIKSNLFINKYRLIFNSSFVCVHSPLGDFKHDWNSIEKAILTKNFFFLYVKEFNGYIISISTKHSTDRNMRELLEFIENNIIPVTKV